MSIYFELHPVTPQVRLIRQAADIVRQGGVIAYPTDSCYALGWHLGDKSALERVRRIRRADRHHHFTLVCADLAEVGRFALLDTWQFRLLKACLPGPYTFLLKASRATPRRLQHEKRRTIGVRIPDHPVPRMLLRELGEPLMSSTLILPDEADHLPLTSGHEIHARLDSRDRRRARWGRLRRRAHHGRRLVGHAAGGGERGPGDSSAPSWDTPWAKRYTDHLRTAERKWR